MSSNKITSWSYSRYSTYQKCPYKAKCKFVLKLEEPSGPAAERGTQIHTVAETYVKNYDHMRTPPELTLFDNWFSFAVENAKQIYTEENWAFTKGFAGMTDWKDWHGAWCRVKVDLAFTYRSDVSGVLVGEAIDHKTGKVRDDEYEEQLELSAIALMEVNKEIHTVFASNWYLDHGPQYNNTIEVPRKDLEKLEAKWSKKVQPMLNDTTFAPRPSGECKWCYQAKSKGGTCKFG